MKCLDPNNWIDIRVYHAYIRGTVEDNSLIIQKFEQPYLDNATGQLGIKYELEASRVFEDGKRVSVSIDSEDNQEILKNLFDTLSAKASQSWHEKMEAAARLYESRSQAILESL